MLDYFLKHKDLPQIQTICHNLNKLKQRIESKNYTSHFKEFKNCEPLFEEIRQIAIQDNDEKLANSQYVFKYYFLTFCELSSYFSHLSNGEYRKSWDILQNCLDAIYQVGRHSETNERLELNNIYNLLIEYEKLYPFKVFSSSELVIKKSHCSICGKSMQSLECSHIRNNLYWGEVATEIVDEIKELQAICLVKHPEDKRCVIMPTDDSKSEKENFCKLDEFLKYHLSLLQLFSLETKLELRKKDIKMIGRNEKCSCGSGIKFKKCCGRNLYYKHENNIITQYQNIELIKF